MDNQSHRITLWNMIIKLIYSTELKKSASPPYFKEA